MVAVPVEAPWCAPRFATPRDPSRRTLGPAVAKVAAMLGTPFMPWQQYVVDVAFEVDESGKLVYREIVLTVPRQSGKTTLLLAVAVHRALAVQQFGKRNKIVYTAQTRKDAREKFQEDFVLGGLEPARRLRGKWRESKGNGDEHVRFLDSGSKFGIDAGTEKSGHGGTLDLAFIDEAFAQVDGRLEQAFGPAMITRPQAQRWVNSTAGWLGGSPYLWAKVEAGRARCESGRHGVTAYFEWSAHPDDDITDPRTWWSFMPALGHTITEDAIQAELESALGSPEGLNGFKRPYGNLWVPKDAPAEQVIPVEAWNDGKVPAIDWHGPFSASIDTTPERDWTAIAVAQGGDRASLEVVDFRPGTWWLVDRAVELDRVLGHPEWLIHGASPAKSYVPDLEAAGLVVRLVGPGDEAAACGLLYDRATSSPPLVEHVGQPEIATALAGAKKRDVGPGGAWGWARKGATPIAPLVALTLAQWGVVTTASAPLVLPQTVPSDRDDVYGIRW